MKVLMAAKGQDMGHNGSKRAKFRRQSCADVMTLGLEVIEVARSLLAVRRLVEQGN